MTSRNIPIILLLLFGLAKQADSQVLIGLLFGEKLNKGPIEFGVDVIGNFSHTSIDNSSDNRKKMGFGLYMDYKINPNLILSTSFYFASPKGEMDFNANDPLYKITDSLLTGANTERLFSYFELPVMFNYRAYGQFGIGVGGYLAYMIDAHDTYQLSIDDGDLINNRSVLSEFNRLDYGAMANLHYHFKGDPGSQIYIAYMLGMADLLKNGDVNGKNITFRIGAKIPIKFGVLPENPENE